MHGHPGGDAHTRYLIELSFLPPGSRWLDMGAGDGQALEILEEEGFSAVGIDLSPRSLRVERGGAQQRTSTPRGEGGWSKAGRKGGEGLQPPGNQRRPP